MRAVLLVGGVGFRLLPFLRDRLGQLARIERSPVPRTVAPSLEEGASGASLAPSEWCEAVRVRCEHGARRCELPKR